MHAMVRTPYRFDPAVLKWFKDDDTVLLIMLTAWLFDGNIATLAKKC
jgi:hypothetical protein